jgi:hypothetical protein
VPDLRPTPSSTRAHRPAARAPRCTRACSARTPSTRSRAARCIPPRPAIPCTTIHCGTGSSAVAASERAVVSHGRRAFGSTRSSSGLHTGRSGAGREGRRGRRRAVPASSVCGSDGRVVRMSWRFHRTASSRRRVARPPGALGEARRPGAKR